jgi:2-C-methyl-D-erythritol 4-phosphate cytidylyltransferase
MERHLVDATDDCQLVLKENHKIKIAKGSEENIKITTELDLIIAEQILRLRVKTLYEEQRSLKGKVFAITGASGDIARAITHLLNLEGAIVLQISRNSVYKADLKDPKQATSIFERIYQEYGEIDGLINCVGSLTRGNIKDLSSIQIIEMIENNFTALALASKYCKVKKEGHIVNFSSSSYTRGRASYAIYSAMKAAIVNFTQAFSLEEPSLQINTLVPSRANTQMRKNNFPNEDYNSLLSCEKIAAEVVKILKTKNITGMTIEINKD